jgi:hypothetical protein
MAAFVQPAAIPVSAPLAVNGSGRGFGQLVDGAGSIHITPPDCTGLVQPVLPWLVGGAVVLMLLMRK